MRIIVDRFEGNSAVVELPNGKTIDCPKELLPSDAKEGSIINILVDKKATNEKLEKSTEKLHRILKDL